MDKTEQELEERKQARLTLHNRSTSSQARRIDKDGNFTYNHVKYTWRTAPKEPPFGIHIYINQSKAIIGIITLKGDVVLPKVHNDDDGFYPLTPNSSAVMYG